MLSEPDRRFLVAAAYTMLGMPPLCGEQGSIGFGHELDLYKREESWIADGLTYCDLTTGPLGQPMTLEERVAEVEQRYGRGDIVSALRQATSHLAAAVASTQERLRQCFDDG